MTDEKDRVALEQEAQDIDLQEGTFLPRNLHNKQKLSEVTVKNVEIQSAPLEGHNPDE